MCWVCVCVCVCVKNCGVYMHMQAGSMWPGNRAAGILSFEELPSSEASTRCLTRAVEELDWGNYTFLESFLFWNWRRIHILVKVNALHWWYKTNNIKYFTATGCWTNYLKKDTKWTFCEFCGTAVLLSPRATVRIWRGLSLTENKEVWGRVQWSIVTLLPVI